MTTAQHFDDFMRTMRAAGYELPAAAFGIGWIVRSTISGFRGAVINVDGAYTAEGGDDWWDQVKDEPVFAKEQPWYAVLGDGENGPRLLYCPEATLERDNSLHPVLNPDIASYFTRFRGDHYDYNPRHDA